MLKSVQLRLGDRRAIWNLVGECRELGDDRVAWRNHWVAVLAGLVDADFGLAGEMAGCLDLSRRDLGVTFWWQPGFLKLETLVNHLARFRNDPRYSPAMIEYFHRYRDHEGLCLSRRDFIEDKDWYASRDYQLIQGPLGADMTLWCFRQIDSAPAGETSNSILLRAKGRRDFSGRDRRIVHEAQAMIAPFVGGALARYAEPSPSQLPRRVRQVLACLLQGDGDKQTAKRLGVAIGTVNEYTKVLYRHFHVNSRAELLARWIRRGWSDRFGWLELVELATSPKVEIENGVVRGASFDPDFAFKPGMGMARTERQ